MKIGLIAAGNLWSSPFIRIYTKLLDSLSVDYDIISWNRDGSDKKEGIQFCYRQKLSANPIAKLYSFWRYSIFVNKVVRQNSYDRLIVFNPQTAIIIFSTLRKYKGRFIFDYRDLSIEQKWMFKGVFKKILSLSAQNFISSPGFKKALPAGFEYKICHNFNSSVVIEALSSPHDFTWNNTTPNVVLTIGAIRDFSSNVSLINSLANNNTFKIKFVGKGPSANDLKEYCDNNNIDNVEFIGYYQKEEEADFIVESSFLNIYYPRQLSHDTAVSNRFYNSLIYKRPMIVTRNTTQGDLAEENGVGIAIENCDGLELKLTEFCKQNFNEYASRCNRLLKRFLTEQETFEQTVASFVGKR